MKNPQKIESITMIDFLSQLYKKYPVLNRLSEQQSNKFQTEIIELLIDQNQNIEKKAYFEVVQTIGLGNFILDILGNVVSRNKLQNQFELNRNITEIANQFESKNKELQKKHKLIERKEARTTKIQAELIDRIKDFAEKQQKQVLNRLTTKENEVKRSIGAELHKLKTKEKLLQEKVEEIKQAKIKFAELQSKQKVMLQKTKMFEKRQKQWKQKEVSITNNNSKQNQLSLLGKENQRLRNQLKELKIKIKNSDMAYRKLKNDLKSKDSKLREVKAAQENKNIQQGKRRLGLDQASQQSQQRHPPTFCVDQLELSIIQQSDKNHNHKFLQDFPQIDQPSEAFSILHEILQSLPRPIQKLIPCSKLSSRIQKIYSDRNLTNPVSAIIQTSKLNVLLLQDKLLHQWDNLQVEYEQNQLLVQEGSLIKELNDVGFKNDKQKLQFVNDHRISTLVERCVSDYKYQRGCSSKLIDIMLELIESSVHYDQILGQLSSQQITNFLQQIYLRFETSNDIVESATLIFSRILLHGTKVKLIDHFWKAIKIRYKMAKVEQGILVSNLRCIIEHFESQN